MKTYPSVLDAWDEVKRLNSAAGRCAYTVTGSVDGYAVRKVVNWSADFQSWRRRFYVQTLGGDLNEVVS